MRRWGVFCCLALAWAAQAQIYINEVFFNPAGLDAPNEYIELRGLPNYILSNGTYFVAVNGSSNANPGTLQNIFDLSGRAMGGDGFLLLLQNSNSYTVSPNATILVNTNGPGWGSGSSSAVGHRGSNGQTDLEHPSITFFLIQTTNAPSFKNDIDPDNSGTPHGPDWAAWTVLDSVGILGRNGLGDIAYGAINFRRNVAATASGTIVPVTFTPDYVGRWQNSTGSAASDWVAASPAGSAPSWFLSSDTAPSNLNGWALNTLGSQNFGTAAFNGVVAAQPANGISLVEGGASGSYRLGLNTPPSGYVTIQISTGGQLQIMTNGGAAWTNSLTLAFNTTNPATLNVRAVADNVLDTSPHWGAIRHTITSTADTVRYPASLLMPIVSVAILEASSLVFSELKVNPPGTNPAPWEFVEIKGPAGTLLTNIYFVAVESRGGKNPGQANLVVNLTSSRIGSSGLLVIGAANNPYAIAPTTGYVGDPRFNQPGGVLGNHSQSFLLVSSPQPILEGADLDSGDNGTLEGLPDGSTIMDSVAFSDGDTNDVFYTSAVLSLPLSAPDAAIRFPINPTPQSLAAWFFGALGGASGDSLVFDSTGLSANFPAGAVLTPGQTNDISLTISGVGPLSGVVGDPTNPGLTFTVADANNTNAAGLFVTAASSNPGVAPNTNLIIVPGPAGLRTLYLYPISVGFSFITVTVSNASRFGQISFPYAASDDMRRPGGFYHTGASDGSTAEALDTAYMLIGDDENQIIRLYDRRRSGPPLAQFDFAANLDLSGQEAGEVDIEASTRVGNRLFWTGSHSHSNLAADRTNRMRFFATDLVGTGPSAQLVFAGYYAHLKTDLTNWDSANGHGKGANYYGLTASAGTNVNPKTPYGFNIEGLSMAPGSTNAAYLGFRAPIVPPTNRTFTLIVPVLNFADLAARTNAPPGSAMFGAPIELDLYGRGIRSLEGTTNGYLISAGNPGDAGQGQYPLDFKLYTWTGNPGDQPEQRTADLSHIQPEGIVEPPPQPWTSDTQVQLVSDLGSKLIYNDGVENKHEPYPAFKKSRSDWVTLGPVVKPMPIILPTRLTATKTTLVWRALKGLAYGVQVKTHLDASAWTDVPGDVTAAGPYASKDLPACVEPQCFYRVVVR